MCEKHAASRAYISAFWWKDCKTGQVSAFAYRHQDLLWSEDPPEMFLRAVLAGQVEMALDIALGSGVFAVPKCRECGDPAFEMILINSGEFGDCLDNRGQMCEDCLLEPYESYEDESCVCGSPSCDGTCDTADERRREDRDMYVDEDDAEYEQIRTRTVLPMVDDDISPTFEGGDEIPF